MSQVALFTEKKLADTLAPKRSDIIQMMGGEIVYKRELSFAIQAANSNSMLATATPESVCKAIYNLAITGLSLNPVYKLAYLTPRRINGKVEAQLSPSYQGLVGLLKSSGCVKQVYAHPWFEGDEFDYTLGTEVQLSHKPKKQSTNILGVYAVAVLPDGEKLVEVMDRKEVEGIRERSDAYRAYKTGKADTTIWVTDEAEMFRKTVIRRIFKYVPKTARYDKVAEAIALDEQEFPATMGQEGYIESLLSSCTYDDDTQSIIRGKLDAGITSGEAENIINDLKLNQLDPVTQGKNYSLTEAAEAAAKK
jgi:recombination protein RecT